MVSIFSFIRSQRPSSSMETSDLPSPKITRTAANGKPTSTSLAPRSSLSDASASLVAISNMAMSATPPPAQRTFDGDRTPTRKNKKRKMPPLESGRTADVVAERWKKLDKDLTRDTTHIAALSTHSKSSWISRFRGLGPFQAEPAKVKTEKGDENIPINTIEKYDSDGDGDTYMEDSIVVTGSEASFDSDEEEQEYGKNEGRALLQQEKFQRTTPSIRGSVLDADMKYEEPDSHGFSRDLANDSYVTSDSALESEPESSDKSEEEDPDEQEDGGSAIDEDWTWLFEDEPPLPDEASAASDAWQVDEDELAAYNQGVAGIDGYANDWTADERRVHRLLALRGFHPLLPGTWTRDFLGVPMYPSLFAPIDGDGDDDDNLNKDIKKSPRPVIISNYSSQFHATKALRGLFDLQARVSGLRQTGHNTARIGAIIERELRRYIAWAALDAGLDRCGPLAAMPNISAKQFLVGNEGEGGKKRKKGKREKDGKQTTKKSLARQVQDYFGDWVARYRTYYASLPEYEVDDPENGQRKSRLRPPRLLYGFVIVQHAVMLLVVNASASKSSRRPRPRCLADFNLSLGDRWLDASLNVAIPVHVARAAQMRCRAGLVLPETHIDDVDEDA